MSSWVIGSDLGSGNGKMMSSWVTTKEYSLGKWEDDEFMG